MVKQALAILQERFAELQRRRERREEKELVKHFAGPGCLYLMFADGSVHPEQAESSVQHQVNCHQYLAQKSSEGCFLSLGSSSECNQGEFRVVSLRAVPPVTRRPKRMTGHPGMSISSRLRGC